MSPAMKIAGVWVTWTFLATGAVGWALFVVLDAFEVKKDAAAWVQAIGSIGAILAAGAVPAWQRRREALRREAEQYERQIADCFQLRRLVHEVVHLLSKADRVNPNWFGSNRELVETGMKDILQRLSALESGRFDKFLLKNTYDLRLIVLDFLGSIRPIDVCNVNRRIIFEDLLNVIKHDVPPYICSLEKALLEVDAESH
jgi:hypothetical protein